MDNAGPGVDDDHLVLDWQRNPQATGPIHFHVVGRGEFDECGEFSDLAGFDIERRAQHAIARAVGEQIAQMEELFNRDHKPSNLIVERWTTSAAPVAIIDCEGVRRATIPGAARMFASLVIEPTGCGVRPRRALMMRAVRAFIDLELGIGTPEAPIHAPRTNADVPRSEYRRMRRMVWDDAARVVAHHGDPRPKVNPLANPGG